MKLLAFLHRNALPLTSLIVSACALFLTLFQAASTERFNRLSLLPHLQFERVHAEDGSKIEFYLVNSGPGPARIAGVEAHVSSTFVRFPSALDWPKIESVLASTSGPSLRGGYFGSLPVNGFVRKEDRALLLRLTVPPPRNIHTLARELEQINLAVCYCSLHGDCFHVAERSGPSDDGTCRYDNTYKLFGHRFRSKSVMPGALDQTTTHGYSN